MDREFLLQLLNTVSVSGNEEANQLNALEFARPFAHEQYVDAVGNAISVVNPDAACRVLLCGHMDEIGFRVTHIDDKGFIHVQKAGGVRPKLYVGAPMQIIHEVVEDGQSVFRKVEGVGAVDDALLKKEEMKDSDLLIDIGANSREEAAARVSAGDSVCADTQVRERLNDRFYNGVLFVQAQLRMGTGSHDQQNNSARKDDHFLKFAHFYPFSVISKTGVSQRKARL